MRFAPIQNPYRRLMRPWKPAVLGNLKMGFLRKTVQKSSKQTNYVKNKFVNSKSINQDPKHLGSDMLK
jgi:hypothetical protein